MSNFIVLSADTSADLEKTLHEVHAHLKKDPDAQINLDRVTKLMEQVKKDNEIIEQVRKSSASYWSKQMCVRLLTAGALVGGLLTIIVQIIDFNQAEGEAIKCIEDFQSSNCTIPHTTIPDYCRKDAVLEWFKLIGTIAAMGFMGAKAFGDEHRKNDDKKKDEILSKVQNKEQIQLFEHFIKTLIRFRTHRDKHHFTACVEDIKSLSENDHYFLPKLGSPELITSYLIEHLNDATLNTKLRRVREAAAKHSRRRRGGHRRRHGEGASSPEPERPFEETWKEVQNEIGLDLKYLKIGNEFVGCDGKIRTSEEDFLQPPPEKPVVDLRIDILDSLEEQK